MVYARIRRFDTQSEMEEAYLANPAAYWACFEFKRTRGSSGAVRQRYVSIRMNADEAPPTAASVQFVRSGDPTGMKQQRHRAVHALVDPCSPVACVPGVLLGGKADSYEAYFDTGYLVLQQYLNLAIQAVANDTVPSASYVDGKHCIRPLTTHRLPLLHDEVEPLHVATRIAQSGE